QADGVLSKILKQVDDTVLSAEVIGELTEGATAAAPASQPAETLAPTAQAEAAPAAAQQAPTAQATSEADYKDQSPAVRKAANTTGVNPADVEGSGRGGRVTKEDMANPTLKANNAIKADNGQVVANAVGQRADKRVPMTRLRARVA
ncbi:E3 binding domain-containing protein, partial [Robertmurraya korlensis]|nr:E3 binding domain-containing protein [Robertmurraya korlensis]